MEEGNSDSILILRRNKKREVHWFSVAGVQGFEPQLADPESAVLPLNDTPISLVECMIPYVLGDVKRCFLLLPRSSSLRRRCAGSAQQSEANAGRSILPGLGEEEYVCIHTGRRA
jgi:hypothetical protein